MVHPPPLGAQPFTDPAIAATAMSPARPDPGQSHVIIFLAVKSARSALSSADLPARSFNGGCRTLFFKGLALHPANPKAIFFFGSLYAIGVPATASSTQLFVIVASVGLLSLTVFHGWPPPRQAPFIASGHGKVCGPGGGRTLSFHPGRLIIVQRQGWRETVGRPSCLADHCLERLKVRAPGFA